MSMDSSHYGSALPLRLTSPQRYTLMFWASESPWMIQNHCCQNLGKITCSQSMESISCIAVYAGWVGGEWVKGGFLQLEKWRHLIRRDPCSTQRGSLSQRGSERCQAKELRSRSWAWFPCGSCFFHLLSWPQWTNRMYGRNYKPSLTVSVDFQERTTWLPVKQQLKSHIWGHYRI